MMKLKERIINGEFVTLEPFEKVADEREAIYNCRSHGCRYVRLPWSDLGISGLVVWLGVTSSQTG